MFSKTTARALWVSRAGVAALGFTMAPFGAEVAAQHPDAGGGPTGCLAGADHLAVEGLARAAISPWVSR
jgi:hypothetical protein